MKENSRVNIEATLGADGRGVPVMTSTFTQNNLKTEEHLSRYIKCETGMGKK